jgi:DNA-binding NarL/FixJ family response regulator
MKWRPVIGFENLYEVSNTGLLLRVASRNAAGLKRNPSIRNASKRDDGYWVVVLCDGEKRHTRYLHRLVAEAWVSNPENKPQVNHRDCDKSNNNANNLEWCTTKENQRHASANGLCNPLRGQDSPHAILSEAQARDIKYGHFGKTQKEIAEQYGISRSTVWAIRAGRNWSHI